MKAKTYEFSSAGLQQAIRERHEAKQRNLMILALTSTITFNLALTLINPVAGFTVIAFKPL